ncbi:MAG: hypothetical protein ACRCSK_04580 [Fusobacteriaceae bacterium]
MDFDNWEQEVYDSTFDSLFDSLIQEYKSGTLTIEQLEMNINEQYTILKNCSTAGAVLFQQCSAQLDAHQFALAYIKKNYL